MSEKKIYIHIGTPKTGTTSLQKFLTNNAKQLENHSIYYPLLGRSYNKMSAYKEQSDLCINGGILNREKELHKLLESFDQSRFSILLLSEECLFLQTKENNFQNNEAIWNLLKKYEIKIIVYFRVSVEYLTSLWQEVIKQGTQKSLHEFLHTSQYNENLINFYDLADKVGIPNVIVKTYEKCRWKDSNIIKDFMSIFNINLDKDFLLDTSWQNDSLTRKQCDHILYVNKFLGQSLEQMSQFNLFFKTNRDVNDLTVIASLSDDTIKEITDKYFNAECNIAKVFLKKEDLFTQKYPAVYNMNRDLYIDNSFSLDNREHLNFIVSTCLQKEILNNQKEILTKQKTIIDTQVKFSNEILALQISHNQSLFTKIKYRYISFWKKFIKLIDSIRNTLSYR